MVLVGAILQYVVKLVIFAAVAFAGVMAGIHLRKAKHRKDDMKGNKTDE